MGGRVYRSSFFRRPLPPKCTAFTSPQGQAFFRDALPQDMTCFFRLAECFEMQNEPAFCALATLTILLNALEMDPMRQWKGPWRYYSQDMLDCCRTLADIEVDGITLAEFECLARCNGLEAATKTSVTLEEFEKDVEAACQSSESFMAISYSRQTFGQTGDGHFSPLAGYNRSSRQALIMDVARFKYPWYWVSIEDLHASMAPLDKATGLPRGYSILRRATDPASTSLFKVAYNKQSWKFLRKQLKDLDLSSGTIQERIQTVMEAIKISPLTPRRPGKVPQQTHVDAEARADNEQVAHEWQRQMDANAAAVEDATGRLGLSLTNERFLFLAALLRSPAAPPNVQLLRPPFEEAVGELPAEVQQELPFLIEQLNSLGTCCAVEKEHECACGANGCTFKG